MAALIKPESEVSHLLANPAKVWVVGREYNQITKDVFTADPKYVIADSLRDSDIVVWTGGNDINPALYDEEPLPETQRATNRDIEDLEAVKQAVAGNKFMVGICRGAQLLNVVVNGGKLWQHVDGHVNGTHRAFDCVTGQYTIVNSYHHQMMRPTDKAQILCWASESLTKKAQYDNWKRPIQRVGSEVLEKDKDIEAVFYPDTDSLLVQFHPEFGHPKTRNYFMFLMNRFYWNLTSAKFDDKGNI